MAAQEISADEGIRTVSKLLSEAGKAGSQATANSGACINNAGGKTYCAETTQEQCRQLKGVWRAGEECPK